jgi:hypothetical protein
MQMASEEPTGGIAGGLYQRLDETGQWFLTKVFGSKIASSEARWRTRIRCGAYIWSFPVIAVIAVTGALWFLLREENPASSIQGFMALALVAWLIVPFPLAALLMSYVEEAYREARRREAAIASQVQAAIQRDDEARREVYRAEWLATATTKGLTKGQVKSLSNLSARSIDTFISEFEVSLSKGNTVQVAHASAQSAALKSSLGCALYLIVATSFTVLGGILLLAR